MPGLPRGRCGLSAFQASSDSQNKLFAMTIALQRLKSGANIQSKSINCMSSQPSKFRLSDAADPRDGVRLIKAFLEIKEPALREKLICLAEDLAKASSDCLGTAQVEDSHRRAFRDFDILATPS